MVSTLNIDVQALIAEFERGTAPETADGYETTEEIADRIGCCESKVRIMLRKAQRFNLLEAQEVKRGHRIDGRRKGPVMAYRIKKK